MLFSELCTTAKNQSTVEIMIILAGTYQEGEQLSGDWEQE